MNIRSMINRTPEVAVIGGGPAGMFAAINLAERGLNVTLYERNPRLGKKLAITGKGRCNVTNNCNRDEFLSNVPTNPKFLFGALSAFTPQDTIDFFESHNVPVKTERGNRVFPVSDKAIDVVRALSNECNDKVNVVHERVDVILSEEGRVVGVKTQSGERRFDAVLLATGGKSYPLTGSDGNGYALARALGHTVVKPLPSLVPLEAYGSRCKRLQGLSLKNVGIRFIDKQTGKILYEDFGEMMFTHFGVTGPTILSATSYIRRENYTGITLSIDLKPALDEKTLDKRILSDFSEANNKDFVNSLSKLLPAKLIDPVVGLTGIDPRKKVNTITKEERKRIVDVLKGLTVPLKGPRPIDEAIVTSGGISTKEINPASMQSKIIDGLYFAGEVIDVDAYTGGFNIQIALSTAYLAARHISGRDFTDLTEI